MNPKQIRQYIKENHLDVEFWEHPNIDALKTEGAAKATGAGQEHILKVLLFIDKRGDQVVTIAQGNKKVDTKKILELKKPDLATPEQVKKVLDAEIGGIAPIALPEAIKKFVDKGVLEMDYVYGSGGSRFASIKLSPKVILRQPKCVVANIVQE